MAEITGITWEITKSVQRGEWYRDPWFYIGIAGIIALAYVWISYPPAPPPTVGRTQFRLEA